MDNITMTSIETDAIGEILNISLGASATAISSMLNARVDITTPVVTVKSKTAFEFSSLEPAVGVEITYVEGLTGSNIMLLKRGDVKIIVEMLMGSEIKDEDFELDEMNISAICEVMNQMMGASSTALSELLSKPVNISTPVSFEVEDSEQFKDKYFTDDNAMVVILFNLKIAGKMESEFMNLMPLGLAKELVAGLFPESTNAAPVLKEEEQMPVTQAEPQADGGEQMMSNEEIEALIAAQAGAPDPIKSAPQQAAGSGLQQPQAATGDLSVMQQMMDMMRQQMEQQQQQIQQMQKSSSAPKQIKVNPMPQASLTTDGDLADSDVNLDLIMGVPLDVSVEIGRTKKLVKDILDMNKGSLVVLDKLAGEQVDVFVNGQCIARGDVVVVEDSFGVRITEILQDEIEIEQ